METINNNRHIIAVALSAVFFIVFAKLVTLVNIGNPNNISLVALAVNVLFSFIYAMLVRDPKWYLGIFTSFVFWVYLSLVSFSLYLDQRPDWWPLSEGLIILMVSCITIFFTHLSKKLFKAFARNGN